MRLINDGRLINGENWTKHEMQVIKHRKISRRDRHWAQKTVR